MVYVLVRIGKIILLFVLLCLIAAVLYIGFKNIFDNDTYDGTFVFEEKVRMFNGYLC